MDIDGRATERETSMGYVRIIDAGRVAICSGASTEVVDWEDVILARSAKNYTWMATRRGAIRVRRPLQVVIETLAELGLVQIHRRTAVNQAKVRRMVRSGNRRLVLILDEDLRLDVGRQFQRMIRAQFGAKQYHPVTAAQARTDLSIEQRIAAQEQLRAQEV
jgi:DNA-binding LytR/AlgR family response regulator